MKVLGCTGGIGSGKTYVTAILGKMGVPAYYSDDRAKELYDTDLSLQKDLIDLLGNEIVRDGAVQRKVIAEKIFNDKKRLEQLEELVHPAVLRDFYKWKEQILLESKADGVFVPFVVFESAILLEKPQVRRCADRVLTVSAPAEVRIERVMARDCVSRDKVLQRMAAQWSDEKREALADFIIFADGKKALLPQITEVYRAMKNSK